MPISTKTRESDLDKGIGVLEYTPVVVGDDGRPIIWDTAGTQFIPLLIT